MLLTMSMSWPSRVLSRLGRAYSRGNTPFSEGLSRSMAIIASSTVTPTDGCRASARSRPQRASGGTQKTLAARYSSGSSASAPWSRSASSAAWCSSKASEMYLRKMSPSTTCLYSAASMLLRSASAVAQSWDSKLGAEAELAFLAIGLSGCETAEDSTAAIIRRPPYRANEPRAAA